MYSVIAKFGLFPRFLSARAGVARSQMLNLFSLAKTPKAETTANKLTAAELRLTKGASRGHAKPRPNTIGI